MIFKGTGSHIDQSDCLLHPFFVQSASIFFLALSSLLISPDGKQFDPRNFQSSDHKLHTKERVYPIIISLSRLFISRVFYEYSMHDFSSIVINFFHYCANIVNTVIFTLFVYYLLLESLQFDITNQIEGKIPFFDSFDQFFSINGEKYRIK